ncbi:MAG: NAD(P)H-binding protein [Sulfitobacter sp.]|nr:NAD(P)H-binding protein [Sulfitobacter sp.]
MSSAAPQTVLITGATGTAGRATALALRDAGHHVIALGRRDPGITGITPVLGDVTKPAVLSATIAIHRPSAVISCLASRTGAPADAWALDHAANLALLEAAQRGDVAHFVLLSAICVQKPRLAFQHAKLAFEAALQASGLTWSIVRPTAYFKSLSGQIDRLRAGKLYLMFGDGQLTACKPISDGDLGRYIAHCLRNPARQNAILPIGGPGPAITPAEMGAALFDALGLPPRYRPVSPRVIGTIAGGLKVAGLFHKGLATKAELARIGHYYATESMLVWDAARQCYDADATPEYGTETLFDFYRDLAAGRVVLDRGDHAVF